MKKKKNLRQKWNLSYLQFIHMTPHSFVHKGKQKRQSNAFIKKKKTHKNEIHQTIRISKTQYIKTCTRAPRIDKGAAAQPSGDFCSSP